MSVLTGTAVVFDSGAQRRALLICVAVSVVLHGLVLFSFPAFRTVTQTNGSMTLTATFAKDPARPGKEDSIEQPVQARPDRPRELPRPVREVTPETPQPAPVQPFPTAAATSRPPVPAPGAAPSTSTSSTATSTSSTADAPGASADARAQAPATAVGAPGKTSTELVDAALLEKYRLGLIDAARRYRRYPVQAMEKGWQGRVEIRLVIGTNGTVKSARIKTSSSYRVLDDQALDMVKRGKGLAPVPPPLQGREFTVDVPVIFELQTG